VVVQLLSLDAFLLVLGVLLKQNLGVALSSSGWIVGVVLLDTGYAIWQMRKTKQRKIR